MSSDLVLKMRTCSAALLTVAGASDGAPKMMLSDAAYLLAEASNRLDEIDETTAEVLEALEIDAPTDAIYSDRAAERITTLPAAVPRPCPACGNVAARKVRITHTKLLLTCPMCSHEWEYAP